MTHRVRLPRASARPAFTLIELLTVIGIIILLIGILLPVLSSVRKAAWSTDSQAAIMNLASACERYRQDFNAYPGPIPNAAFNAANGLATTGDVKTTSENGLVGLIGGWEPGATAASFVAAQVGNGPMSHNPLPSARKRFRPYVDAAFGTNVQSYTSAATWNRTAMTTDQHPYDSTDGTLVPEFIDKFPDPMPIIYLRARTGAPSFTTGTTIDATTQYNPAHLYPYVKGGDATGFPGSSEDLNHNGVTDRGENINGSAEAEGAPSEKDFASAGLYFRNPGVPTEVRQKDGFWLIGAGPDRKFGTKDDQTNMGPIQ